MLWNQLDQSVILGWDFYGPVILFVILVALAVPVWAAIGSSAIVMLLWSGALPLSLVGEKLFSGIDFFALTAVPLFILTGDVLVRTGLSRKFLDVAEALTKRADFDMSNPNRFRSVIGGLTAGNPAGFHAADGRGYAFLTDWLLRLDASNPQTAARMSTAFETWRRYDADRQALIRTQLQRMAEAKTSRDLSEMVERMLNG